MGPSDCDAHLTPSEGEMEGWVDVSSTVVGTPPETCPREGPWVSLSLPLCPCLARGSSLRGLGTDAGMGLTALLWLPSAVCSTS